METTVQLPTCILYSRFLSAFTTSRLHICSESKDMPQLPYFITHHRKKNRIQIRDISWNGERYHLFSPYIVCHILLPYQNNMSDHKTSQCYKLNQSYVDLNQ